MTLEGIPDQVFCPQVPGPIRAVNATRDRRCHDLRPDKRVDSIRTIKRAGFLQAACMPAVRQGSGVLPCCQRLTAGSDHGRSRSSTRPGWSTPRSSAASRSLPSRSAVTVESDPAVSCYHDPFIDGLQRLAAYHGVATWSRGCRRFATGAGSGARPRSWGSGLASRRVTSVVRGEPTKPLWLTRHTTIPFPETAH